MTPLSWAPGCLLSPVRRVRLGICCLETLWTVTASGLVISVTLGEIILGVDKVKPKGWFKYI